MAASQCAREGIHGLIYSGSDTLNDPVNTRHVPTQRAEQARGERVVKGKWGTMLGIGPLKETANVV